MAGTLSASITGHQPLIAVTALGLVLATVIATLAGHKRNHTTNTAEDCCAPSAQPEENVDQARGHRSN